LLYHKYYVDQIYDRVIVKPLRALAYICYYFDQLVIDGLVILCAWLARLTGHALRPAQSGRLQGYGVGMALGVAVILLVLLFARTYATGKG
jgi:NADH-quinone oxidoreductase subunit L